MPTSEASIRPCPRTHSLRRPLGPVGRAPAAFTLALGLATLTLPALAQRPVSEASVESLVAALAGPHGGGADGPATRSFRRTQLPDVQSNLCGEAARPARSAAAPAVQGGSRATRTLEVVPYAGDSTPGVNLAVQFAIGSDRLAAADRALLDNVAAALKSPTLAADTFAIAGHTDATGDGRLNLELSCARALAVRRHLVERGVAEARLTAYGFGSARPLEGDGAAPANRRVEVRKAPQ